MTLRLNGSTSGYAEIDAPAVAGSNTLVLPGGNGSADQVLATNGSGTLSFVDRGRMVLETAKASTSGTSVDFTGIPSWVKRVTVMFSGVSTSGTSQVLIQIGTSSGVSTTGYASNASSVALAANTSSTNNHNNGFAVVTSQQAAAVNTLNGFSSLSTLGSNAWVAGGTVMSSSSSGTNFHAGAITLSGTLDRIRITTSNGTDTFDAGSINLLLEG